MSLSMSPPPQRRTRSALDRSAVTHLSALLAATFHQDALTRWIVPDERRRAELLPGFFRVFVELSASYDAVLTSPDGDAVILFLPPGAEPDEAALGAALAESLGEAYAPALATVTALQAEHHPTDRPHYYLAFGAVRADRQRSGVLSGLLTELMGRADREGVAAYAEASSPGGEAVTRRLGFTRLGGDIVLPGDGPTLRPMWRDPR
ncbi:hypothetical protein [Streptomyces sp. NPDC090022]|uniref:hypothetical protein n=1 Tax=Streptomyces sp. NPDC090022 TaxID=3365920 RepID=UPI003830AACF